MKLKLKRSAGVVRSHDEANEAQPASARGRASANSASPDMQAMPAAAGTLHRAYVGGYAPPPEFDDDVEPARDRSRFRIKASVPTGKVGRILLGCAAFFCLGAAAAAVYAARNYLMHDERFIIPASANIEISGNQHMTRAQLLNVFGADVERSIFRVPLAERRSDLEHLPWVDHATVMRLLPNHIRVVVTERTPVAFMRQGTNIGLVDANGVLLDMPAESAGDPRYSFPVLTGLSESDPLSTRAARMEIYRAFMKAIAGGGPGMADKVSEVDVSNPEDVKAMIAEDGSDILVHFGDEDFLSRFQHFEEHLAEWKQQYPKLASADMRYERQVVLEMQPGAGIPMTAQPVSAVDGQPAAPTSAAATSQVSNSKPGPPKNFAKPAAAKAAVKSSAANEKMFHALAAARQTGAATPAPNATGATQ